MMFGSETRARIVAALGAALLLSMAAPVPGAAQSKAKPAKPAAEAEPPTEADIREVLDAWADALSDSDVEALGKLLEEDVVFLPAGQPALEGRTAVLDSYRALFAQYRVEWELEVEEIEIGGRWAWVRGAESFRLRPTGAGDELETASRRVLTVLHRDDEGTWRFARAMTNRENPRPTALRP